MHYIDASGTNSYSRCFAARFLGALVLTSGLFLLGESNAVEMRCSRFGRTDHLPGVTHACCTKLMEDKPLTNRAEAKLWQHLNCVVTCNG